MRIYYLLVFVLILLATSFTLKAIPRAKNPMKSIDYIGFANGKSALYDQLNQIIRGFSGNADIAVYVKSMRHGDVLYAHNSDAPLVPASTLKILTAEAALIYLGPSYKFSTRLVTDAKSLNNGVLQGNLYLVLSGDPTLTYHDVVDLMYALKERGITRITGNVYVDDTAFDQNYYGSGWNEKDKNSCFAAPISAGIINRNCLPLQVKPAKAAGRVAKITVSPNYFYPTIQNTVMTKARRARSCGLRFGADLGSLIALEGCVGLGSYGWGLSYVISNPASYNVALVKGVLRQLNVSVNGHIALKQAPGQLARLNSHESKSLDELVHHMLKKSDNVIAAALFKKLGQLYFHKQGSWENGSLAVSRILNQHARMTTYGMRIMDGSGLSKENLITPAQMMHVLEYAFKQPRVYDSLFNGLPIAGIDGTLKYRMGHLGRKVHAKTGTIAGVVSLAGYATAANQEPLAFVIMVNGLNRGATWRYKTMEDKLVTALTRFNR